MEYAETGTPGGVPVVFLHGVTDSWRSFEPVLRQLPPSIHAFALSQRGHGESSRPDGYSYRDMSEDVAAFMDVAGIEKAVLVGHSMGSLVAQRCAIDHPGRVLAVVLIGAFSTLHGRADIAEFVASAIAPLRDPIDPAFAREWQVSTLARAIDPAFLDAVVSETLKVPARVWHRTFSSFLETPDFSPQLATISVPALLMWGDRDTYALSTDQDVLVGRIPGVRLLTYEGAGHALHWEDPAQITADLMEFTASILGADAPA
jgi:pimeloyl-ACP methyl ester carboxylesterase